MTRVEFKKLPDGTRVLFTPDNSLGTLSWNRGYTNFAEIKWDDGQGTNLNVQHDDMDYWLIDLILAPATVPEKAK